MVCLSRILKWSIYKATGKNKDWYQVAAKRMQFYPSILFFYSYSYALKPE